MPTLPCSIAPSLGKVLCSGGGGCAGASIDTHQRQLLTAETSSSPFWRMESENSTRGSQHFWLLTVSSHIRKKDQRILWPPQMASVYGCWAVASLPVKWQSPHGLWKEMNLLQYLAHNRLAANGDKLSMLYFPALSALQVVARLIFISHLGALRGPLCFILKQAWMRVQKKIEAKCYHIPKMAVNCQSLSKWFFLRQNI